MIAKNDENDFLNAFIISDATEIFWIELDIETYLWNSFKKQDSKSLTHVRVNPGVSNKVNMGHIGLLIQELACPYGQWDQCFFYLRMV